ncbi:DUF1800 family protein [Aliiroseovarius sp. PrR006]|uniref:DUF1800 family protein n=1 Tax=Aliiroseovarius sp. PrR006 TaxID=2706883 RepID=UPI0013D6E283|nr:DUF1800 family protein [Aliiroseovarius sp. PrR006]NDW53293.1 DUF1800 domain-containing protein [Aliiroseovarius sp. PrR006]
MSFDPRIAQSRFGFGPGPGFELPRSAQQMLNLLAGPDRQAKRFPISGFVDVSDDLRELRKLNKTLRKARGAGGVGFKTAQAARKEKYRETRGKRDAWFLAAMARCTTAEDAFRERLVRFWADHFTVVGKGQLFRGVASTFPEDVVRPHVTGRFADTLTSLNRKTRNQLLFGPLKLMGQPWEAPGGPDGWPEDAAHWITPQGLAARIQWAVSAPSSFGVKLPDPRDFVQTALAGQASKVTEFAARAAETRWEGIGIILSSPEFQRR